jgi:protein involved in polysaccharide export with SLBB domain
MKPIVFFILCVFMAGLLYAQAGSEEEALEHYRVGKIYYEHGLYKEAEREFSRALQILKREPEAARASGVGVVERRQAQERAEGEVEEIGEEEEIALIPSVSVASYIIGEGDTLDIRVWENPDLDQQAIVRPDGMISFPLIDEIKAAGLTVPELDRVITEALKAYIRFPDVSISLKKMAAGKVIILGEVDYPGVYSIVGRTSLLEVIALAGGFTEHSIASSVVVVKEGFASPSAERFDLNKAIHRADSSQNVLVESGDIVFVPKKFIADVNYFLTTLLGPLLDEITSAQTVSRGAKRW